MRSFDEFTLNSYNIVTIEYVTKVQNITRGYFVTHVHFSSVVLEITFKVSHTCCWKAVVVNAVYFVAKILALCVIVSVLYGLKRFTSL